MTTNVHNDRIDADAPSLNGSPNDAITTSTKTPPQVNAEPTGLRFEILELALMMTPATGDGGLRILELAPTPHRSPAGHCTPGSAGAAGWSRCTRPPRSPTPRSSSPTLGGWPIAPGRWRPGGPTTPRTT